MPAFRRLPLRHRAIGAIVGVAIAAVPASVVMAADLANLAPLQVTVPDQPVVQAAAPEVDANELECMAKVVMHEAGNQPYDGQVAVAQTLVNRLGAKRFGASVCEVANQRGQYFNTAAYDPDRASDAWLTAAQVARAVLTGSEDAVAPGALFFRAAASPQSSFFRTRQRVTSVGAHIFYR